MLLIFEYILFTIRSSANDDDKLFAVFIIFFTPRALKQRNMFKSGNMSMPSAKYLCKEFKKSEAEG